MSKGWRIIGGIVLVLLLLGAISIGVGFLTGGNINNITDQLEQQYLLTQRWEAYSQWGTTVFQNIVEGVKGLW